MANNINLFQTFVPMLDEVYKLASLTSLLDGASELAKQGANAKEMIIPMLDMQGLADYGRNSGYVNGDVTMTSQTRICNFDRGRLFVVDQLDNAETAGLAFGRLLGEFLRSKVVPELDAFRMACYAGKAGVTVKNGSLATGADVLAALRTAMNRMDEDEVPYENRVLFITPTLMGLVEDLDTTKSKQVLVRMQETVCMPQNRFYTKIKQLDGTSLGETAGGYAKAEDGKNIQFMIIHKDAVMQFQKHVAPKVIAPEQNPDADAWKLGYRNVGIADVYQNKLAGVYVHTV